MYILLPFLLLCALLLAQNQRVVRTDKDSLREILKTDVSPEQRLEATIRLARKLSSEDPAGTKRLVKSIKALATELDDKAAMAQSHNILGSVYFYSGEYDEALVEWQFCYGIYASLDSTDAQGEHSLALASALNNMGIVYKRQGDLPAALELYYSALKIREEVGTPYPIGASYLNIGGIYKTQGNPDQAMLFFKKAQQLFEEAGDTYGQAAVFNNLGNIYEQDGDLDKAEDTYKEALRLFEEEDNLRGIGLGMSNLGMVYQMRGDCEQALVHFARTKEIRDQTGDKAGLASVLQKIADCYATMGKERLAISGYERSLALAEEDKMVKLLMDGHEGIAKIYARTGQYEKAFKSQQLFHNMKDSLFDEESRSKLENIEKRYEAFRETRAYNSLDKQFLEQSASLKIRERMILALFISLLAIVALLVVTFRRYRTNRALSKKLEERNLDVARTNRHLLETQVSKEEKEELLKEIHHRVKNNLQIINSLLRFQGYKMNDPEVVKHFEECQERIMSMSLLHEQLYRKENLSMVDVPAYLKSLVEGIRETYAKHKRIVLDLDVQVESFGVNTMIPLGLVVNEIVSNAFKHGFKDRENGILELKLERIDDEFQMMISDNGHGFEDRDIWDDPDTLGFELIKIFVGQLDGHTELSQVVGTTFNTYFKQQKENIRLAEP